MSYAKAKAFVLVMTTQSHLSKICTMIYTNKGDTHTPILMRTFH